MTAPRITMPDGKPACTRREGASAMNRPDRAPAAEWRLPDDDTTEAGLLPGSV